MVYIYIYMVYIYFYFILFFSDFPWTSGFPSEVDLCSFINSRRCGYGLKLVPSSNPRGFLGQICRKANKKTIGGSIFAVSG